MLYQCYHSYPTIHLLHCCNSSYSYSTHHYTHYPPLTLSLHLSSLVVGRSRCEQLRHRQRCYTYLLPLYTSLTVKFKPARAHVLSPLNAHTHGDTKIAGLLNQPALCFSCLAAKCGVHVSAWLSWHTPGSTRTRC
jgi:hypothetical protein